MDPHVRRFAESILPAILHYVVNVAMVFYNKAKCLLTQPTLVPEETVCLLDAPRIYCFFLLILAHFVIENLRCKEIQV